MRRNISVLLAALFLPGLLFAAESRQKVFVSWHDDPEENFSRLPAGEMKHARRAAFPMKGRAIVIDAFRPVKVTRIVLPLKKLNPDSPETVSEAAQSRVYAGNDPGQLALAEQVVVALEAKVLEGVPYETVTISGLPEARYFQIHAPRNKTPYVFGLEDAFTQVEVHTAETDGTTAATVGYPERKDLDFSADRDALPIAGCGFRDHGSEEKLLLDPVLPEGGTAQIGWPWRQRSVGFILEQPAALGKIVFTLEKMQPQRPELTTGLENAQVFASLDNRKFTRIMPQIDTQLYRDGEKLFARVTLQGTFRGQYFRVYAPWEHPFYVFGSQRLDTSIKAFSNARARARDFAVPLSASGSFPVCFRLAGADRTNGKALLYAEGREDPLWQADFAQIDAGQSNFVTLSPEHWEPGIRKLRLVVREENNEFPQSIEQSLRFQPGDLLLSPESTAGFRVQEMQIGSEKIRFLIAESKGAAIEYLVPAAGSYAMYVTLKGEGKVKVTTGDIDSILDLHLWHPQDLQNNLTGENFAGAAEFSAGAKIRITAMTEGACIGNLKLSPVSRRQLEIFQAVPEIRPAAIIHSDGYSDFFSHEVTPEELRQRIDLFKANHAFAYDWCVGTTAVNYPSKVATPFGQQREVKFWRNGDRLAAERLEKLLSAGHDPIRILREYTLEKKLRLSLTQRAGAYYKNQDSRSMNAQFFIDHPEFYQQDSNGRIWEKPSYAYPEVRQFYLDMIREMAAYKPDAITIEFLRHPPYFRYDQPLIDEYIRRHGQCGTENYLDERWQKIQCDIMTAHLQEIRRILDAADPAIQLEISFDWHDYFQQGIDLKSILELGLVDLISPGIYYVGKEKYFPLQPFADLARLSPRKVLLFPRVEATIFGGDPTPDEEKGLVKIARKNLSVPMFQQLYLAFLAEGADGIRPFNTGGPWLAKTLADRSELRRFQTFVLPLLDLRRIAERSLN